MAAGGVKRAELDFRERPLREDNGADQARSRCRLPRGGRPRRDDMAEVPEAFRAEAEEVVERKDHANAVTAAQPAEWA